MLNDEPGRKDKGAEEDAKEGRLGRRVKGREKIKNGGGNRRGVGNNATICQLSNCASAWWGELCRKRGKGLRRTRRWVERAKGGVGRRGD